LIEVSKDRFAYTVVDLPMTITSWTAAVLRSVDVIYVVVELSVPSVQKTRKFLDLLQQEGMARLPIRIVVNRYRSGLSSGYDVSVSKFAKAIGREIDHVIPNDFKLISNSHGQGRPAIELKPKSGFSKALQAMLSKDLGETSVARRPGGLRNSWRK